MTKQDMEQLVRKSIADTLKNNTAAMVERMTKTIDDSDNTNARIGKMTANSISISVELSVLMTLEVLEKLGILDYSNYESLPEKPELKILK